MGIGGCQDWSTGLDGRELGGPAVAQLLEWCLSVVFCGPKDVTAKSEGFKSTFFVETSRIMHLSQHFHVFPLSDCVESLKGFLLSGMGFSRQLGHSGRFLPLHAPCGWQRLAKVGRVLGLILCGHCQRSSGPSAAGTAGCARGPGPNNTRTAFRAYRGRHKFTQSFWGGAEATVCLCFMAPKSHCEVGKFSGK